MLANQIFKMYLNGWGAGDLRHAESTDTENSAERNITKS